MVCTGIVVCKVWYGLVCDYVYMYIYIYTILHKLYMYIYIYILITLYSLTISTKKNNINQYHTILEYFLSTIISPSILGVTLPPAVTPALGL